MLTIKRNQRGRAYTVVKTKRGPRARQISREGVTWLRERFPTDRYPRLEDIPFNYDLYMQLRSLGFTGTRCSSSSKRRDRRKAGVPEVVEAVDDLFNQQTKHRVPKHPFPRVGPAASMPAPTAQRMPEPTFRCIGCAGILPDGSHFCPRCGRGSGAGATRSPGSSEKFWTLLVTAAVILAWIFWRCLIH